MQDSFFFSCVLEFGINANKVYYDKNKTSSLESYLLPSSSIISKNKSNFYYKDFALIDFKILIKLFHDIFPLLLNK